MKRRPALAGISAGLVILAATSVAPAQQTGASPDPVETRVPVDRTSLYARAVGQGEPVIVLHGGPDFDHRYLLPDLDQFRDRFRLIYYDQRGRGRSADGVSPKDVTLASDVEDVDRVRQHFRLEAPVLLGHSWGAVLALEYALRHPTRVSRLILMNPAPVSAADLALMRQKYLAKLGADMDRQREISSSAAYVAGDPGAVTARYRIHFRHALKRPADYERLMTAMQEAFVSQGRDGIVKARAVEDELMADTWQNPDYDLLPKVSSLRIPTLVLTGEDDFIPIEISQRIANAIPGARLVMIPECGHFAYLECAGAVRRAFDAFLPPTTKPPQTPGTPTLAALTLPEDRLPADCTLAPANPAPERPSSVITPPCSGAWSRSTSAEPEFRLKPELREVRDREPHLRDEHHAVHVRP